MKNAGSIFLNIALSLFVVVFAAGLLCAAGVDPESTVEDVKIRIDGVEQEYILMNSSLNKHQWYCARKNPMVVERKVGKTTDPDFSFIKFQRVDPKNPQKLDEGGLLQFSFEIGPKKAALTALKSKLPKNVDRKLARVDPLPLQGVELNLFGPRGKKIPAVATTTPGIASDYSSQFARFNVVFDSLDADLVESIIRKPTGIKYQLGYRYYTLGAPVETKVKVDWDKLAKKGGQGVSFDDGKSNPLIMSYLAGRAKNPRVAQRLRAGAKARQTSKEASSREEARELARSDGRKKSASTSDSSEKKTKPGELLETLSFVHRAREQRTLAADGFLGLGSYPKDVQDRHVIMESNEDGWKNAYLIMPTIGDYPDLKIDKVVLEVELRSSKYVFEKRTFNWTSETNWTDDDKVPVTLARFPLKDALAAEDDLTKVYFKVARTVNGSGDPPLTGVNEIPVLTGDSPLASPLEMTDVVIFDFSNLYWDAPETDKTRLLKVEINLQEDKRRVTRYVSPAKRSDGTIDWPELVPILVNSGSFDKPYGVKVSVFFHTADRKKVAWDFNALDLHEAFAGGYITFLDADWQRN